MVITDIRVYRDGGSIEFKVESNPSVHVWLNTPFAGDPRQLRINGVPVPKSDPAIKPLLLQIAAWESALETKIAIKVNEVMAHKGPWMNPDKPTSEAITLSLVLRVRNYVQDHYI